MNASPRRRRGGALLVGVLVGCVLVAGGCGGDDETPASSTTASTATTTPPRSDLPADATLADRLAVQGYRFEAKPETEVVQQYPDYLVGQGLADYFDGFVSGPVRTGDGTGVANVLVLRAKPDQDLDALDRRIQRVLTGTTSSQIRSGVRVFLGQSQIDDTVWTRYVFFRDGALYVLDGPDPGRLDTFLEALLAV